MIRHLRNARHAFANLKLKWKFSLINLFVVLIPSLLIGTFFYSYVYQVIQTNDISYKSSIVQLMAERINDYVRQVERLTYSMYKKEEQAMLAAPPATNSLHDSSYNEKLFASFLDSSNFTVVEGTIDNALFVHANGRLRQSGNYLADASYEYTRTSWYRQAMDSGGETFVFFPNNRDYSVIPSEQSIGFVRKINSIDTNLPLGVLLIDIPVLSIGKLLRAFHPKGDSSIYLIDERGYVLYSNQDGGLIGKQLPSAYYEWASAHADGPQIGYADNERMIASSIVSNMNWRIVSVDRMSDLSLTLDKLRNRAYLLVLLSLLIGILLANSFTSRVTSAISFLQQRMRRFQEGDFTVAVKWTRRDEIGQLASSFNEMIAHMADLIHNNYIIRLKEREAQFKALQAQINPHFLYNTLDLIINIALLKRVPLIVDISRRLADMFKYSISKKGPIVTLEEELEHVGHYLSIMNFRYNKKFIVEMDIAPETMQLPVIKFSLQPIVENAIYHGLEIKIGTGTLRIHSSVRNDIHIIEIVNDGLPIPPERLEQLQSRLSGHYPPAPEAADGKESIGLLNVQERIQLHFGANYGLQISSGDSETKVRLELPAVRRQ